MSVRRALLTLAVLLTAAAPAAAAPQPRIVGGTPAAPGAYPSQAEITFSTATGSFLCGGTLVAPQWVLTAGHCVTDEDTGALIPAAAYTAALGSTVLDQGTPYAVDQVVRAPGYSSQTLAYDAALLHLATPAPDATLPLLTTAQAAFAAPGKVARVIGWGTTSEGGQVSSDLLAVDVPIVSDTTCHQAYGSSLVAATMLCAGYAQGGRDACQGDSGGPLLVDVGGSWALAGVVSTGDGCAEAGRYGIYTDTLNTTLRSWFFSTTGLTDAAPATTPTPTATAVPTVTPAPTAVVVPTATPAAPPTPRAGLHLGRSCSLRACAFRVSFSGIGTVEASVTLRLRTAQQLGFAGRRIAAGQIQVNGARTLHLALPRSLRHRLRHAVPAQLRVAATNADGVRTVATRTVKLRP